MKDSLHIQLNSQVDHLVLKPKHIYVPDQLTLLEECTCCRGSSSSWSYFHPINFKKGTIKIPPPIPKVVDTVAN